ncbi:CopD family protein [Streptomyces sp. RPA4-2]|uniref:CopD family protein n=1 Tax=Streptomyces sp. RPA4-2 TaxID=2721244 RepID=UPI0034E8435B
MTSPRPTAEAAGTSGPARRPAAGPAVALLVLVALAALIPLLGPRPALDGTGEAAAPGVGGIALLRTVLFAALCVPAGELFAARPARRVPGAPSRVTPRSWAPYAAAAGFVAAPGLASVVATGNLLPHHLSDMDVGGLYRTRDGKLALLAVNAFAVAGLCALSRRPAAQVRPLATVAEALRSHPPAEQHPLIGSGPTLVHVTCAALWAGGLPHVLRMLRAWGAAEAGAALLGRYARVAAVLFAVITATAAGSTLRRMPSGTVLDQLTSTSYGRALPAKLLLVAAVAVLALLARLRLRRPADRLGAGVPTQVAGSLRTVSSRW